MDLRYPSFMRLCLFLCFALAFSLSPGAEDARAESVMHEEELRVCFVPLGKHDAGLIENARRGAEYLYGAKAIILPKEKLPQKAYYKPRRRYRAEKLLDYLLAEHDDDGRCDLLVGFTAIDISTTKEQHVDWGVLGLGEIDGKACVVSTFRMKRKAKRAKQIRRAVSTTNHEIGHVLGAPHGGAPGCLMNDAQGTIRTIDAEHGLLCSESRMLIEKRLGRQLPVIDRFDWDKVR